MKRARRRPEPRLPPPGRDALAALGPYARTRLEVRALGLKLPLDVPTGVFSTQRIDEGTRLLLAHLPARPPRSLLEIGCGYGALGLPIAAKFPDCRALLLDRDLLAVRACEHNARQLGLANAAVVPGLGFRDVAPLERWDLVLCNVPARIGPAFIGHLLTEGRARLAQGGEVRVVVIRDLERAVEAVAIDGLARIARGPRHTVYSIQFSPAAGADGTTEDALYARDETDLVVEPGRALRLSRPHDASEDPRHGAGLSVLLDALPRSAPPRAFVFRAGYGALPLALRARHPSAEVVAQERDLLDAAFIRRNAAALGLGGPRLEVVEALFVAEALRGRPPPDLMVGELSAAAGEKASALELRQAADGLAAGGQALILSTARQERDWMATILPPGATVLLRREGFSVLRLVARTR